MNGISRAAFAAFALVTATQAAAQITFYEREGFRGRAFTTDRQIGNFERFGFNDRASSVVVQGERWTRWEVCEDMRFSGRCVILRPGRYPSLGEMGLNDRVSSARAVYRQARVDDDRYSPAPAPVYDYRRRNNERVHQANVTSVRAVFGAPERRCWVEREQVSQGRGNANVGGAIAGAIIGGILGHQIGGGHGQDIATAGGAVAGAAVGANVGRDRGTTYGGNVQHCESAPRQGEPAYWDVTYNFRGQLHRMQTVAPPGPTVLVNEQGEPRA